MGPKRVTTTTQGHEIEKCTELKECYETYVHQDKAFSGSSLVTKKLKTDASAGWPCRFM